MSASQAADDLAHWQPEPLSAGSMREHDRSGLGAPRARAMNTGWHQEPQPRSPAATTAQATLTADCQGSGPPSPGERSSSAEPTAHGPQASTDAPPLRALVLGYGSPIRGDDALGPLVADRLQQRFAAEREANAASASAAVEVQARHILTAELVDDLARAERVIFVDAAIDIPPGQVSRRRLSPDRSALSTMAHFHDPRELLAWCEALYQRAPEAWLVSGGGAHWDYACYALSETAQQAVEPMMAEVLSLIETADA